MPFVHLNLVDIDDKALVEPVAAMKNIVPEAYLQLFLSSIGVIMSMSLSRDAALNLRPPLL